MLLEINFQSDEPIYLQLRNQIIEGIAQKKILPGDPLPPVRQMATELGINLHTVRKTYNLLKQAGFIDIQERKGVLIKPVENPPDIDFASYLEGAMRPYIAEAISRGIFIEEFQQICEKIFKEMKGEME
jgi:GntR family transcriptional regulator